MKIPLTKIYAEQAKKTLEEGPKKRPPSYDAEMEELWTDSADGWDEEALNQFGLMDWLADVAKVQYEIKNARRGSYGIEGDEPGDMISTLHELYNKFEEIISQMIEEAEEYR